MRNKILDWRKEKYDKETGEVVDVFDRKQLKLSVGGLKFSLKEKEPTAS